ncbi:M48 family metallopeptidase [Bacteroidota bacterium]
MEEIKIDKIVRSRRRTFSLEVNKNAELIVRAPLRATNSEIHEIVNEKSQWIFKKKEDIKYKESQKKKREFINGEIFECLGKEYTLVIKDNFEYAFSFSGKEIIINAKYKNSVKIFLIHWYKRQAYNYISERTEYFANAIGVIFHKVRITSAKSRWGSCSANKNLNFSWRLILAPKQIVDYVIVHELVHLIEMNHSKRFWDRVSRIMPNYKIYETWLKNNGHLLDL